MGNGGWCSFIRNIPIPTNVASTFKIKQSQTANRNIMTGIATNAVFGQINAYQYKDCLAYWSSNGKLFKNGSG